MIDTSHISLSSLVNIPLKKSGAFLYGACPFCGGKDRFLIKDEKSWFCRGCSPKYQDVIAFIQRRDSATFFEACQILKLEIEKPRTPQPRPARPPVAVSDLDETKPILSDSAYHASALDFVTRSIHALESDAGEKAREYLANRGIHRAFILQCLLGFNAEEKRETWGAVNVWLPRGVIIPHWRQSLDALWRINIRRAVGDPKYIQPAGCSTHGLYVVGYLRADCTVVLVEGEFDALCLKSYLRTHKHGQQIVAIATGSAHAARVLRNVATLSVVRRVLVAFDADQAGDDAAEWWLTALGRTARRARPYEHDITDMHHAGNLTAWINDYLK